MTKKRFGGKLRNIVSAVKTAQRLEVRSTYTALLCAVTPQYDVLTAVVAG